MPKFKIGRLVATAAISERMDSESEFKAFLNDSFQRYHNCDWGVLADEDKTANDQAVTNGERILASYVYPKTKEKVWFITEWDRSVTTILYPREY